MAALPARKVPGIGLVTQSILNHFGLFTCQESEMVQNGLGHKTDHLFTQDTANWLRSTALGIAANRHAQTRHERLQKSVGQSQSFPVISGSRELQPSSSLLPLSS